jgi:hypothetical protein
VNGLSSRFAHLFHDDGFHCMLLSLEIMRVLSRCKLCCFDGSTVRCCLRSKNVCDHSCSFCQLLIGQLRKIHTALREANLNVFDWLTPGIMQHRDFNRSWKRSGESPFCEARGVSRITDNPKTELLRFSTACRRNSIGGAERSAETYVRTPYVLSLLRRVILFWFHFLAPARP